MEWRGLEEHFRSAVTQRPAPFGDDAIEWDYSRYARALGLTGLRGLHDLPHSGVSVVALPRSRWTTARRKYEGWARPAGWTVERVSARPSVLVPDAFVHELGVAVCGEDGMIFARSGRGGRPALGARPRPEACSIPLTPGERWLIASDRVRRRVRSEIAQRGIVLFIEDAHQLTGAAMSLLMHLLDAHRAWTDRMLSRDAKIFVVLATTPERADQVDGMLRRFGVSDDVPVARDRRWEREDASRAPDLTVEQEHVLGALATAPLALCEKDVRAVFGSTGLATARELVANGYLRSRLEYGQRCFVAEPAQCAGAPPPPERVVRALEQLYRARSRRRHGHEHLHYALAVLACRRGENARAAVHLGRCEAANAATVPLALHEELEAGFTDEEAPPQRAIHRAIRAAVHAHHRDYERAQALAEELTQRPIRDANEFHRVLVQILCVGRTHMDAFMPDGFWAALQIQKIDGAFADAACILAELFARLRVMRFGDRIQRYECARDCLSRAQRLPGSNEALTVLVQSLFLRVQVTLETHGVLKPEVRSRDRMKSVVHHAQLPAYVVATVVFSELQRPVSEARAHFCRDDRFLGLELVYATGLAHDSRIQLAGCASVMFQRHMRLALRDCCDEQVLLLLPNLPEEIRRYQYWHLQNIAGPRAWRLSANTLLGQNSMSSSGEGKTFEAAALTEAHLCAGDYSGARDCLASVPTRSSLSPLRLAFLLRTRVLVSRKTLEWQRLDEDEAQLREERHRLPAVLFDHLSHFLEGSLRLCTGELSAAEASFDAAAETMGRCTVGEPLLLKTSANESAGVCRRIRGLLLGRRKPQELIAALVNTPRSSHGRSNPVASNLDFVVVGLELWARSAQRNESVLGAALLLRQEVDAALRSIRDDIVSALARRAPTFFARLEQEVRSLVGSIMPSAPAVRAVSSGLGVIEKLWSDSRNALRTTFERPGMNVRTGSGARQLRRNDKACLEDAAVYAHVTELLASRPRPGHRRVLSYGFLGAEGVEPKVVPIDMQLSYDRHGTAIIQLRDTASRLVGKREASSSRRSSRGEVSRREGQFLGSSDEAKEVRQAILDASTCTYPVLIVGETGVGKEVVARSIHALSDRSSKTLVIADCASTADSVLESELFGHARGAFTGAYTDRVGYFESADESSLFLDEVDSMSPRMQAALLRVLETGEYRPVGTVSHKRSNFRLIAAAMPRLNRLLESGAFRSDLYYRISTMRIVVPPLRDRAGDARELARMFAKDLGVTVDAGGLDVVEGFGWPGNVRQLRSCIEVAKIMARDGRLGRSVLADAISSFGNTAPPQEPQDSAEAAWSRSMAALTSRADFGAREFASAARISRRTAQRHLARLADGGRIVRIGAGRATRYRAT